MTAVLEFEGGPVTAEAVRFLMNFLDFTARVKERDEQLAQQYSDGSVRINDNRAGELREGNTSRDAGCQRGEYATPWWSAKSAQSSRWGGCLGIPRSDAGLNGSAGQPTPLREDRGCPIPCVPGERQSIPVRRSCPDS